MKNIVKMNNESSEVNTNELYDNLMSGYEGSPFVSSNWPMQNGVYRQYSGFENNDSCPSGTSVSIRAIAL